MSFSGLSSSRTLLLIALFPALGFAEEGETDARPVAVTDVRVSISAGLDWLVAHQSKDGRWDCDGFPSACTCGGGGGARYDEGVTGLATLALMRAGSSTTHGLHTRSVKRAIAWLIAQQDPEGCVGRRTSGHFVYNHAIATLALVEAYGVSKTDELKAAATKAMSFVEKSRNPYLGWRYGVRPGDNDSSVTSWMVRTVVAARDAGLPVANGPKMISGANAWFDKVTLDATGVVGYTARGNGPARPTAMIDKFPADKSHALTAAGLLARLRIDRDAVARSDVLKKSVALCVSLPPKWDPDSGHIDMYYWFHATSALAIVGGEGWTSWRAALTKALVPNQRPEGHAKGSWDPIGLWGGDGGRVYSTATCVLSLLEVNDRVSLLIARLVLFPPAPVDDETKATVARLLEKVESDRFAVRDEAQAAVAALIETTPMAAMLFRAAIERGVSLEARHRLEKALQGADGLLAVIEMIEREGLATDRAFLEKLAASSDPKTAEAAKARLASLK